MRSENPADDAFLTPNNDPVTNAGWIPNVQAIESVTAFDAPEEPGDPAGSRWFLVIYREPAGGT